MQLYPLRGALPGLAELEARGEVSRLYREPRTVEQVLRAASEAMDREDAAAERARDPIIWARAERRKHSLFWRLFG